MRLAIITTHPIQYYAPVFKLLQQRQNLTIKVFYTWGTQAVNKFDPGFNKSIQWDIPLMEGYDYEWVQNTSPWPGSHHFSGIINSGLINHIENFKADAILVYGWSYYSHLKAMRYFQGKMPVYFRGDSILLNEPSGLKRWFKMAYLTWIYKYADHVFYVGTNNKAYFKRYGLKEPQLSFAPHAIDNDRFAISRQAEVTALRLSMQLKNDDVLILFAGKFDPVKNAEILVAAVAALNQPYIHLLLVGNGINEQALKLQADTAKWKNIHFMNFQNQDYMPVLYQAADLFCLPSISETWGLSVNEAMACGKAVLVSDKVGCAADLVIPGDTGEIFESGNLADITSKLIALTKDKAALKVLGNNAKNKIADWSFVNQVAAMLRTFNTNHAS